MEATIRPADDFKRTAPWPDPEPHMVEDPRFNAIWDCIKTWDINVPTAYSGYMGATGNHVRAIMDALDAAGFLIVTEECIDGG